MTDVLPSEKLYRLNALISIQIARDKPLSVDQMMSLNLELGKIIKELRDAEK